jgi:hypothetical protein
MPAHDLPLARLELGNRLVDELHLFVLDGLDLRIECRRVGDDRLERRAVGKHRLVERDRAGGDTQRLDDGSCGESRCLAQLARSRRTSLRRDESRLGALDHAPALDDLLRKADQA